MNKKQLLIAGSLIVVLLVIYLITSSGRGVQKSVSGESISVDSSAVFGIAVGSAG